MNTDIKAVLWDFGGVILSSPFEAFREYERERGLPGDFIRTVNTNDPDANAWARLERSELNHDEFDAAFAEESARLGHEVRGADVLALLAGEVRPEMVAALDRVIAAGYRTACLTNNVTKTDEVDPTANERADVAEVMSKFDVVVESSKVGVRKPEPGFYERACELLGVEPADCVFLDDLGINLKPAKAMGMRTIKVGEPGPAIAELGEILQIDLTGGY
ncbi:HAD-IA family hydrolase [Epidermidibacterium keratini]|uniref:HAD-IA family hydrolase n=1 Tax=Epidermidibacterium keratini TaxID=1891644 RepID=A0A7L4YRG9_9ACTN|nr:HAD-IA family hydrolase [Epidermidibacterium keratini]QHC01841.1 HAD-IA family hydrolase [Epidermidibacterium keratini]